MAPVSRAIWVKVACNCSVAAAFWLLRSAWLASGRMDSPLRLADGWYSRCGCRITVKLRFARAGCRHEIHNLNHGTPAGEDLSDHLKYFTEHLPATFIYAGIDVERCGVFTGTRGRQLAGAATATSPSCTIRGD